MSHPEGVQDCGDDACLFADARVGCVEVFVLRERSTMTSVDVLLFAWAMSLSLLPIATVLS